MRRIVISTSVLSHGLAALTILSLRPEIAQSCCFVGSLGAAMPVNFTGTRHILELRYLVQSTIELLVQHLAWLWPVPATTYPDKYAATAKVYQKPGTTPSK